MNDVSACFVPHSLYASVHCVYISICCCFKVVFYFCMIRVPYICTTPICDIIIAKYAICAKTVGDTMFCVSFSNSGGRYT